METGVRSQNTNRKPSSGDQCSFTRVQAELRLAGSLACQDEHAAETHAATGVVVPCAAGVTVSVISDELKAPFCEDAKTLRRENPAGWITHPSQIRNGLCPITYEAGGHEETLGPGMGKL